MGAGAGGQIALSDILRIEDSPDVVQARCPATGIPLWSTIRIAFLRLIVGDLFYSAPLIDIGGALLRPGNKLKAVAIISRAFAHNALRYQTLWREYPIVVMATGARLVEREQRYFNNLSDYFVSAAPDRTYSVEQLFGWRWPFPRHHDKVLLHLPLDVSGALQGRWRARGYRASAQALVALVSQRAKNLLGWELGDGRRRWLETFCARGAASLLPRYRAYRKLLDKTGARVLIKEEACYGGPDNACAMLAARHAGVVTAEYQHGMVSLGHDAYNYAPAVLNDSAYRQLFPDYFLSFGSWWEAQINVPVKKLAIGNPHRSETVARGAGADRVGRRQVLVLGEAIETTRYLDICMRLAEQLGSSYEVVFRPHPLERGLVWSTHPTGSVGKVRIDPRPDIYAAFGEAAVVIGEASTGLFEAIGLVPKILLWDTPKARYSYPRHPFHRFEDPGELAGLILDDNAGRVTPQQMDSIWAPDWRRNYRNFIEQAVRR